MDYNNQVNFTICLKSKEKIKQIKLENIVLLLCDSYITYIYTINNSREVVCKLLKELEEDLSPYGFIRISRNTIINLKHLDELNLQKNTIRLSNSQEVKLAKNRINCIKSALG
jgi:two-component system LytT family response regulator